MYMCVCVCVCIMSRSETHRHGRHTGHVPRSKILIEAVRCVKRVLQKVHHAVIERILI